MGIEFGLFYPSGSIKLDHARRWLGWAPIAGINQQSMFNAECGGQALPYPAVPPDSPLPSRAESASCAGAAAAEGNSFSSRTVLCCLPPSLVGRESSPRSRRHYHTPVASEQSIPNPGPEPRPWGEVIEADVMDP
ncbi:hypothetical protein JX265_009718 [Neoarthrinium moseri]|uniref:Uncharacterized protein n=1 Tax=Neoarthrinium moseri TaxID=1658444 RepID=A0A9P9WFV4_9PEZI|nr:hypothetical protein JX265_009718 [Neoarthrinium moseri]